MAGVRQWNEGGHAVVQATFGVELASPAAAATVRELLALHSKLRDRFPRKRETKGRMIGIPSDAFEAEEFRPDVGEPTLTGFTLDSLYSDGRVERSITLDGRRLSVTRADYEGWGKTWGEVRDVFVLMFPILLERSSVAGFHLQYQDRFVWEGEREDFRSDMIFRRESKLLVPNIFEVQDLWHSYHGYFEYPQAPHTHQLLSVAEVQLVPPENAGLEPDSGLVAEVRVRHRAIPGVERAGGPGRAIDDAEQLLGDGAGLVDHYMDEMHDKNKWILSRVINDDMCDAVGLPRPA